MSIAAHHQPATTTTSALRKIAGNGQCNEHGEEEYVVISADTFALTGKMPLSSLSQTSTCSSSMEGSVLSDVSPMASSCSERSSLHADEKAALPAAEVDTTRSSPIKTRGKLPTLEAIAARLSKKADATHGDPSLDQENQSQQCTPVRPTARHAYTPTRQAEASPSKQARGRSEMLTSLVDRAHDRSRSASPVKRESSVSATPAGMTGSGPSLQDIINRMGNRKDMSSTSAASSPAIESTATPPPSTPSRATSVTPQPASQRDASTSTDNASKPAVARKSPSKLDRIRPDEHPLEHRWSIYFDSKSWSAAGGAEQTPSKTRSWEATLKMLGRYDTVESFMTVFRTLRRPSQLERNSNYHLFKDGIKPMWEDPANLNGGKWVITLRTNNQALLDRSWMWLVLALIGEDLDENDDVTGAVVSTRAKGDRIALWVRDKSDIELVNRIGRRFVSLLDIENEAGVSLEFSPNSPEETDNASFSSSTSTSSSAGLRSSLRRDAATKFIGFSNPAHNNVPIMHLPPKKGPSTPQQAPSHAVVSFAHHAVSPLSLSASQPNSPMQAQGSLGAHLRVHASPGKMQPNGASSALGRTSAASSVGVPALIRRGSQQDGDGGVGLGFAKGFGGPIGRTGSPSPAASNPFRNSIGASPSGGGSSGGFGLMNRTKV